MNHQTVQEGKTIAIISYITIIGTLIAFIMNQNKQNYFASFHIRQSLGIFILGILVNFIQRFTHFDWFDAVLGIGVFILWILGLVSALQGKDNPIPLIGEQFQEWFRNIS